MVRAVSARAAVVLTASTCCALQGPLCRELIDRCCPQQHRMHAQNSMHQQAHGAWASRAHPTRPHRPLSSLQQQGSRQARGQAACAAPARERSGTPAAPHNGDTSAPAPLSQAERDDMEAAARAMADSLEAVCAGLSEETPIDTAALNSIMEVGAQGAATSGTAE